MKTEGSFWFQHEESNNSSLRSELGDFNSGYAPRSPTGSVQGIMVDMSGSRPASITPPLPHQKSLYAQMSADSSCLVLTPTSDYTPGLHPTLGNGVPPFSTNTLKAMEKKRSLDSQTFLSCRNK